ncbi:MAG: hypothetical protein OXT69_01165 [Candidatus Poribacteria bacterium]|nr:hypothetical protein [Candidatus Poribacteria bacterium]
MKQAAALALCAILSSALTVNGQEPSVDAHLGRVLDAINQRFDDAEKRIDQRFDAINQRFDAVDKRLGSIETRLNEVESKVDHVSGQLSMAMWIFTALIALGGLFASVYFALRKRKGEDGTAGGKNKNPYQNPQSEYMEGVL